MGDRDDASSALDAYAAPASLVWSFCLFLAGTAAVAIVSLTGVAGGAVYVAMAGAAIGLLAGLTFIVLTMREARRNGESVVRVAWTGIKACFTLLLQVF